MEMHYSRAQDHNNAAACAQRQGMLSTRVEKGWTALCRTWNSTSPGTIVFSVPSLVLIILHQQTLNLLACPRTFHDMKT